MIFSRIDLTVTNICDRILSCNKLYLSSNCHKLTDTQQTWGRIAFQNNRYVWSVSSLMAGVSRTTGAVTKCRWRQSCCNDLFTRIRCKVGGVCQVAAEQMSEGRTDVFEKVCWKENNIFLHRGEWRLHTPLLTSEYSLPSCSNNEFHARNSLWFSQEQMASLMSQNYIWVDALFTNSTQGQQPWKKTQKVLTSVWKWS